MDSREKSTTAADELVRTEIGLLPPDWDVRRLGDLFDFSGGYSASRAQLSDVGYCYLHYGDIHGSSKTRIDTQRDYSRIPKLNVSLRDVSPRSLLEDGDVVFVDASEDDEGTSRHVVIANKGGVPFISGLHTIVAKSKTDELSHEYRSYCFQSQSVKAQFVHHAAGTKVVGISKSNIRKLLLAVPKQEEQQAIAQALFDVDGLLGALEALIAKKRAIKRAAMGQLLTGATRLPGYTDQWNTYRLGEHVTFLRHGINSRAELTENDPVRYLHYGDIHAAIDPYLDVRVTSMPRLTVDRARVLDRLDDGDLVFVDASEDVKGVGTSLEVKRSQGVEVVAGLHTIAARFDKAVLVDGFKAYLQFCASFRVHLQRLAAGTKVLATNRTHIASAEVRLPAPQEQLAIAAVLNDIDAELAALWVRREKLLAIKRGMMQQLLTGRIRLVGPSPDQQLT